MPRSKHSEAAIIAALQQLDAGRKAAEVAREVGREHVHDLCLESEVRRHGRERGPGGETAAR